MNPSGNDLQGSIKLVISETLSEILSQDGKVRQAAEQKIQALEVTEEFGICLTEFVVNPNGPLAIRQLASVLLKQYVETHWTIHAEKYRPPELKPHTKERIKELLPLGLRESISKIRTAVAYAISAIAYWDWPENWPGLFDILVSCLSGENEFSVHGAMRVLTEFTRDLSDTHLPQVGPVILQEMYRIIQSESKYSIRVRARAVEIFTKITKLIATVDLHQKGFAQQYLHPVIPMFCEKFVQCLGMQNGPTSDSGLKTEIMKSISTLILSMPKYVTPYLPQILSPVWNTYTESAKIYQEKIVNGDGNDDDKEVDSDGEVINFDNLIIATFEVIGTLLDHKKFAYLLDNFLEDVLYYLVIFMQVTDEQIELWNNSPNQFIEEEDNTAFAYNVRISAQELLVGVFNYDAEKAINALWRAIEKHLKLAEQTSTTSSNAWKVHEASIYALSLGKDTITEKFEAGVLQFDLLTFLNTVVLGILNNSSAHPLLLGRCLCLGGQYGKIMPPEMTSRFVEATVNGLQANHPICIRISSVKTIYSLCSIAIHEKTKVELLTILKSHLPATFEGMFTLASHLGSSKEILSVVMETFSLIILLDDDFTASVEGRISPFTIAVLTKFQSDQFLAIICQDIFKGLTKNPNCVEGLHTRLVPILIRMMSLDPLNKPQADMSITVECHGLALDTLRVLVRFSPTPLSNLLIDTAFSTACHCILNSDDNNTLQSGGELIRTYISVAPQQITEHRDNDGHTGLQYILQIVAQLLNPQSSEYTATFIGPLLTTLVRKLGSALGENLDLLLKGVLSKMQRTETLTVMQSLIMVFAHLINTEFDAALNFLSTVPGPTGKSALHFVLTEWVSRQHVFFGRYDRKVTVIALCKLLEYGVTQDDSRLNEITVKEEIQQESEGIRTRSKTQGQPCMWNNVPILVKIFKLIVNELSNDLEAAAAATDDFESEEEGEDDEIDVGTDVACFEFEDEEQDEEEDPDLLQDSIYLLNLNQYLQDFLQNFSKHYNFSAFAQQLNNSERKVLGKLNINVSFM